MEKSIIFIDPERVIEAIDPHLFGGFIEHMGRCVYEGIYDPKSKHADENGFRNDVRDALRALGPTIIRYPGGNFLSGYHWLDGVGPKEKRPHRRELAWKSIETNQFGTNEFMRYCHELGAEPMLGVNMGTGTIEEAAALVEYCNAPAGTYYADLRKEHGFTEPYGVRTWCLGNEMDGPWQIGHLEAVEYGRKAKEAAKMMHLIDPSLKLVACGSSGTGMTTYPEWDRTVMEICWEHVDYLSMHYYAGNRDGDSASYLALAKQFEQHIDTLAGTLAYVKAKNRSKHEVYLSWDEWNVWYKNMHMDGEWKQAPHLIEEVYNLEDALVVAQWLHVFLRRCNVLKMACLAQLVNVIAPILTRGDEMLIQSIYYPFQLLRKTVKGNALDVSVQAPNTFTAQYGDVSILDAAGAFDSETGKGMLSVVNRSLDKGTTVQLRWQGEGTVRANRMYVLAGNDVRECNTFEEPGKVRTVESSHYALEDGDLHFGAPGLSHTVIEFEVV